VQVHSAGTVNTVEPELGYWVYALTVHSHTVLGVPVTSMQNHALASGWNMVGSIFGTDVDVTNPAAFSDNPPDSVQRNAVYTWNPITKSYVSVQPGGAAPAIESAKGYWVFTVNACVLSMS